MARTEIEVAADTIVALMADGLLSARHRLAATASAGLTYPDVQEALERRHELGFVAPTAPDATAEPEPFRYRNAKPCPNGCGRSFVHPGRHLSVCTGAPT